MAGGGTSEVQELRERLDKLEEAVASLVGRPEASSPPETPKASRRPSKPTRVA